MLATKDMIKGMEDCTFKKMKEVGSYAVISKKSPLMDKKEITFEDLKGERLITLYPKYIPFQYGDKLQEKIVLHAQAHFHMICEND